MTRRRYKPVNASKPVQVIRKEKRTNVKGGCGCGKKHKVIRSH